MLIIEVIGLNLYTKYSLLFFTTVGNLNEFSGYFNFDTLYLGVLLTCVNKTNFKIVNYDNDNVLATTGITYLLRRLSPTYIHT